MHTVVKLVNSAIRECKLFWVLINQRNILFIRARFNIFTSYDEPDVKESQTMCWCWILQCCFDDSISSFCWWRQMKNCWLAVTMHWMSSNWRCSWNKVSRVLVNVKEREIEAKNKDLQSRRIAVVQRFPFYQVPFILFYCCRWFHRLPFHVHFRSRYFLLFHTTIGINVSVCDYLMIMPQHMGDSLNGFLINHNKPGALFTTHEHTFTRYCRACTVAWYTQYTNL